MLGTTQPGATTPPPATTEQCAPHRSASRAARPQARTARRAGAPLRIGITGHIRLAVPSHPLIYQALRGTLVDLGAPVHGVTCLADGTDQLFAQALLDAGFGYDVVLPARDYREREVAPDNRAAFDRLLERAREISYAYGMSCAQAYAAAGDKVLEECDRLVAVWDGSAGGLGGTACVVAKARSLDIPVTVIWPPGAHRR